MKMKKNVRVSVPPMVQPVFFGDQRHARKLDRGLTLAPEITVDLGRRRHATRALH